jgi:hypothetical protein
MLIIDKRSFATLLLLLPLASSRKLRGEKAALAALSKPLHHEVKSINSDLTTDEKVTINAVDGEVQPNQHSSSKKPKSVDDDAVAPPSNGSAGTTLPRACSAYSACNGQFPGDCCPTVENVFLGCCYGALPDQPVVTPTNPVAAPVPSPISAPTPQQVVPPAAACSSNPFCVANGITGMCCPTTDKRMLGKLEVSLQALTAVLSSIRTTCLKNCTSLFWTPTRLLFRSHCTGQFVTCTSSYKQSFVFQQHTVRQAKLDWRLLSQ